MVWVQISSCRSLRPLDTWMFVVLRITEVAVWTDDSRGKWPVMFSFWFSLVNGTLNIIYFLIVKLLFHQQTMFYLQAIYTFQYPYILLLFSVPLLVFPGFSSGSPPIAVSIFVTSFFNHFNHIFKKFFKQRLFTPKTNCSLINTYNWNVKYIIYIMMPV